MLNVYGTCTCHVCMHLELGCVHGRGGDLLELGGGGGRGQRHLITVRARG